MSQKYPAVVHPTVLEDFNDEMNPLRIMLQDHFATISENPEEEAIRAIINTSILRDYGETLTNGLRRHLHEKCGFLLTSMTFEGFHSTPNNVDNYFLEISMNKGDIHLLDFYILDEDIEEAIEKDIRNDSTGVYQQCSDQVSDWRVKSPEQRTAVERGVLVNAAASNEWAYDIDFKNLREKISKLQPQLEQSRSVSKKNNVECAIESPSI